MLELHGFSQRQCSEDAFFTLTTILTDTPYAAAAAWSRRASSIEK
jgi:hypothetical protein